MKSDLRPYETNYFLLHRLLSCENPDESLFKEISKIRKKLKMPDNITAIDPFEPGGDGVKGYQEANEKLLTFLSKSEEAQKNLLQAESSKLQKKFSLGNEWNFPIKRMVVCGVFVPPMNNIYWEEKKERKLICLEINRYTSKADLDYAWKALAPQRKDFFKKTRAPFLSKKEKANCKLYLDDLTSRSRKESVTDLAENNNSYKKTDLDFVGELFSNEEDISEKADKKRMNRLRVNRHRQRKQRKITK
jgi:hypothetical protein